MFCQCLCINRLWCKLTRVRVVSSVWLDATDHIPLLWILCGGEQCVWDASWAMSTAMRSCNLSTAQQEHPSVRTAWTVELLVYMCRRTCSIKHHEGSLYNALFVLTTGSRNPDVWGQARFKFMQHCMRCILSSALSFLTAATDNEQLLWFVQSLSSAPLYPQYIKIQVKAWHGWKAETVHREPALCFIDLIWCFMMSQSSQVTIKETVEVDMT